MSESALIAIGEEGSLVGPSKCQLCRFPAAKACSQRRRGSRRPRGAPAMVSEGELAFQSVENGLDPLEDQVIDSADLATF